MNTKDYFLKLLVISPLLFNSFLVFGDTDHPNAIALSKIPVPTGLYKLPKTSSTFTANYVDTSCLNFALTREKKKRIGVLCSSTDSNFLNDMGVTYAKEQSSSFNKLPLKLFVATGVSQYPMELFIQGKSPVYATTVDCDEANKPVYRPTSSCHIAIHFLDEKKFLYSNFTLNNHVDRSKKTSIGDIKKLWQKLLPAI
jgi:hypothetical protein